MAKQTINIGAAPNDGTGTPLRTSFDYTNQNFTELYTALGGGVGLPGATTQVIFNDGGTNLAGDAGLTYNKTTDALAVAGTLGVGGTIYLGGGALAAYLNGFLMFGSSSNTLNFFAQSSGIAIKNNSGTANLFTADNLGNFGFGDGAGGTRMTLNSTALGVGVAPVAGRGALQLSAGVGFPATQVASTDVNTLDDYEEGTFTPTIVGGTTAGVGTYVVQSGNYTKVGNLVTFRLYVATSAHTGTGAMRISSLPFTSNGTGNQLYSASISNLGGLTLTASNVAQAYIDNGVNYITVSQYATGGGPSSAVSICPAPYILVSGSYMV